jgi:hypothetical protein
VRLVHTIVKVASIRYIFFFCRELTDQNKIVFMSIPDATKPRTINADKAAWSLELHTVWRCVAIFRLRPLCSRRKNTRHPLVGDWVSSRASLNIISDRSRSTGIQLGASHFTYLYGPILTTNKFFCFKIAAILTPFWFLIY